MAKAAKKKAPTQKKAVKKPKTKLKYYFTVKDSVKVVQDRAGPKANKRVKEVFNSLVKHLHAFIKRRFIFESPFFYFTP